MGPSTVHLLEILHRRGGNMVDPFTNLISGVHFRCLNYSLRIPRTGIKTIISCCLRNTKVYRSESVYWS